MVFLLGILVGFKGVKRKEKKISSVFNVYGWGWGERLEDILREYFREERKNRKKIEKLLYC